MGFPITYMINKSDMKIKLKTYRKTLLADTLTPVNIYLKLRDVFAASILLESSDYHGHENALSFICCEPIASFSVARGVATVAYPGSSPVKTIIERKGQVTTMLEEFLDSFQPDPDIRSRHPNCGLFGYLAYDSVRYFEDISLSLPETLIPDIQYKLYRYVIVVDHFSNELSLYEHTTGNGASSNLDRVEQIIMSNRFSTYPFSIRGPEEANCTDTEFLELIEKGKEHCFRGDVFQIVLSRRFSSGFAGD